MKEGAEGLYEVRTVSKGGRCWRSWGKGSKFVYDQGKWLVMCKQKDYFLNLWGQGGRVYALLHAHAETRGGHQCLPLSPSALFSHWKWSSPFHLAWWVGDSLGSGSPPTPWCWDYRCVLLCPDFIQELWEFEDCSSPLHSKCFYTFSHLEGHCSEPCVSLCEHHF